MMKAKFTLLAVCLICGLPLVVEAQNIFRTGRPVYARPSYNAPVPNAPLYAPRIDRNWSRSTGVENRPGFVSRIPSTYPAPASPVSWPRDNDFARLQSAWENYRREAQRYQQRYGNSVSATTTASYGAPVRGPVILPGASAPGAVVPNSFAPNRFAPERSYADGVYGSHCVPRFESNNDVNRNDSYRSRPVPADVRPSLVPVAPQSTPTWSPDYYESSQTISNGPTVAELTRTASRPIADFFTWLTQ